MNAIFLRTFFLLTACRPEMVNIGGVEFVGQCLEVADGQKALAVADLDQDGHLDLVIANLAEDSLVVFRGNGRGSFTRLGSSPAGANPTDLVAADINEDGAIDLVVANHETSYLTLLIGDGYGGFRPDANSPLTIDVDPHPHAVGVEDIDGDGHVDLVVDDRTRRGLVVLRGLGDGAFETSGTLIEVGGDPYRGFAIGDLNGDGRLDLVTPNPKEVGVLVGTGSESIVFHRASPLPNSSPFAVAIADINGDGFPDVIASSERGGSHVRVFLGDGHVVFREADDSPFRMTSGAKDITVGDVNGDGVEDVLISSWSSDVLFVLGGAATLRAVRLPGFENPWGLAIGDLNEDGRDDFVIADGVDSKIRIYTSRVR